MSAFPALSLLSHFKILQGLANIFLNAKTSKDKKPTTKKPAKKNPVTRKPIPATKPKSSKVTTSPTQESQQAIDEQEFNKPNIDGSISMIGLTPNGFNPLVEEFQFMLSGAEFGEVSTILVGGELIDPSLYTVDATKRIITVNYKLKDGENKVYLKAFDTFSRPNFFMETYWAGSTNLVVNLVNWENEQPVNTAVTVVAFLPEAQHVIAQQTTSSGSIILSNVPKRTLIVEATGADGSSGSAGGDPLIGTMVIWMKGLSEPGDSNLDFANNNLDGWKLDGDESSASIVPHAESYDNDRRKMETNYDLLLITVDEGEQYIHHPFVPREGITGVKVRYRFQTDEFPRYFGTQYNDYFSVSITSVYGDLFSIGKESESNSMNGLGRSAFLQGGYTEWREVLLKVNSGVTSIEVDAIVANVGDEEFESRVFIDFIEELGDINDFVKPSITWDGNNGGISLSYEILEQTSVDTEIGLFWAHGSNVGDHAFQTILVPAGKSPGIYGPTNIPVKLISPEGATGIVAISGTRKHLLPDVEVLKGVNADFNTVTPLMFSIIKAGLRAAGQSQAYISSTTRTAEDQARAMYNNLVKAEKTIAQNIQDQLNIYTAAGDAVVMVFANMVAGMTREQITASSPSIKAAMVVEIEKQGKSNVSRHCADPSEWCVVDVGDALLPGGKGQRFVDFIQATLLQYPGGQYLDERLTNHCHHLVLEAKATVAFPTSPPSCTISDGRKGTCINKLDCGAGMEPVPYANEPEPNCKVYPINVQCCVTRNGPAPPPTPCPDVLGPDFINFLKLAEGYVGAFPYPSLEGGNPTVGYGHKLTDDELNNGDFDEGLSEAEATTLLLEDATLAVGQAKTVYNNAHGLGAYNDAPVWGKRMLIDKVFQAGAGGLQQFVKMMKAIFDKNKDAAYAESLTGYIDTNKQWQWDYGRQEKFKTYAMVNC